MVSEVESILARGRASFAGIANANLKGIQNLARLNARVFGDYMKLVFRAVDEPMNYRRDSNEVANSFAALAATLIEKRDFSLDDLFSVFGSLYGLSAQEFRESLGTIVYDPFQLKDRSVWSPDDSGLVYMPFVSNAPPAYRMLKAYNLFLEDSELEAEARSIERSRFSAPEFFDLQKSLDKDPAKNDEMSCYNEASILYYYMRDDVRKDLRFLDNKAIKDFCSENIPDVIFLRSLAIGESVLQTLDIIPKLGFGGDLPYARAVGLAIAMVGGFSDFRGLANSGIALAQYSRNNPDFWPYAYLSSSFHREFYEHIVS